MKELININIFGGPGTGKSTAAAGIFYKMKSKNFKVEYIQEYAKDLSFGKDFTKLSDQLLILGEQHHRTFRVNGQVDYLVHDSPFVMGLVYLEDETHLPKKQYTKLITKMFNSYNNINIFLERNIDEHKYEEYGRNQTFSEALQKDGEIQKLLNDFDINYQVVKAGKNAVKDIFKIIKES